MTSPGNPPQPLSDEWWEDHTPCCDYTDHSGERPACACPEHRQTSLHPYGHVIGGRS